MRCAAEWRATNNVSMFKVQCTLYNLELCTWNLNKKDRRKTDENRSFWSGAPHRRMAK